jgi:hypothetical protein
MRTVVRSVLLPGDHALRVEQRAHRASSDFVDNTWLEIDVEGAGDILARSRLREER